MKDKRNEIEGWARDALVRVVRISEYVADGELAEASLALDNLADDLAALEKEA